MIVSAYVSQQKTKLNPHGLWGLCPLALTTIIYQEKRRRKRSQVFLWSQTPFLNSTLSRLQKNNFRVDKLNIAWIKKKKKVSGFLRGSLRWSFAFWSLRFGEIPSHRVSRASYFIPKHRSRNRTSPQETNLHPQSRLSWQEKVCLGQTN